nr:adenylyltransferase/cytidyltransferase family protein [Dehalococcoidia bacterium]
MTLLSRGETARRATEARDAGNIVVFTNGCFDLLHSGHVTLLEVAAGEGDLLIVGLNSDSS